MIKTFKNIEPLQIKEINIYEIVGKNNNNCMVFCGGVYCFEGTETQCLDYIKSQPQQKPQPKQKQATNIEFYPKKRIETIKKPKKVIKNIVKPITQLSLF